LRDAALNLPGARYPFACCGAALVIDKSQTLTRSARRSVAHSRASATSGPDEAAYPISASSQSGRGRSSRMAMTA